MRARPISPTGKSLGMFGCERPNVRTRVGTKQVQFGNAHTIVCAVARFVAHKDQTKQTLWTGT